MKGKKDQCYTESNTIPLNLTILTQNPFLTYEKIRADNFLHVTMSLKPQAGIGKGFLSPGCNNESGRD